MRSTQLGLLLGAIYGVVLVMEGLGEMLIVVLVSAVGWAVAAAVTGELDLSDLVDRSFAGRIGPGAMTRPRPAERFRRLVARLDPARWCPRLPG